MALNFDLAAATNTQDVIEVVCKFDSCLDMDEQEYSAYIASGADPSLLKLKKGKAITDCTLFVLKKNLDFGSHEKLMKKQFSLDPATNRPVPNPGFVMTEVRAALIDIKNPEDAEFKLPYKRDRGMASLELVTGLQNAGILLDLFTARQASTKGGKSALVEKKNS